MNKKELDLKGALEVAEFDIIELQLAVSEIKYRQVALGEELLARLDALELILLSMNQ